MKDLKKNKYFISVIIISTIVLAIVASFTAYRLYQLREEPVAPNVPQGNVYAFSCEEYQMLIDTNGVIRISNVSGDSQPSQNIEIVVGGQSLGSFSIPALDPQTNAEIGGINLPAGDFNWNIDGDILCSGNQSGTLHETQSCNTLIVKVANAQTFPTSTPTPTPSSSTINPTNTPTPTATPTTVTSTPIPTTTQSQNNQTNTPTPTPNTLQVSETNQLPDTGSSNITLLITFLSVSSILGTIYIFSKNIT
ncbi:hypothetical protein JXA63_04610 [Candidatus Woesebacteria bacterium]|nr:hypothetical protein [Candidatus Woesebacteria bacterium]